MSRGQIWTDEEIQLLITLVAAHKTVHEIATRMNRSHIEILGKLARLGLRAPGSLKTIDKSRPAPLSPLSTFGGTPRPQKHKAAPTTPDEPRPAPTTAPRPAPLPRAKRPGGGCRFPMWGFGKYPTHVYCDKPRISPDLSYCSEHHKICMAGRPPGRL